MTEWFIFGFGVGAFVTAWLSLVLSYRERVKKNEEEMRTFGAVFFEVSGLDAPPSDEEVDPHDDPDWWKKG